MPNDSGTAKRGPSQTAQLAAFHRAYHTLYARPPILDDSAATWLLGPPLSVILRVAPLRWFFWEHLLAPIRPISVFIVVRSRYAEDCLEEAIADGCRQVVVLGAGLDSWALRHATLGVRVVELDHPATQQWKRARICARLGALPAHLTLVPIDFEREAINDVLRGGAYDPDAGALISWLGTIYYLTRSAIAKTWASLALACAPGSRVVFDYFLSKSAMSPADLRLFEGLDRGGAQGGEPMRTLLDPEEVTGVLRSAGFRLIEDLSASEIRRRYLLGRSDGLDIPGFVRLCCAEREGAA